jgi:uncharacterized protein HemX
MVSIKRDERGIGHLEGVLVIVIVAVIGFVGWYVYHTKQNSDTALNNAASTSNGAGPRFTKNTKSTAAANASTSNASLQTDQQSAASSANQGSKDLSASNDGLSDQSTLTSVPQ